MTPFVFLLCSFVLVITGCRRHTASQPNASSNQAAEAKFDVCGLITGEEIEKVQGSRLQGTKSSGSSSGGMRVSQCFYSTAEFTKSVSLAVTQSDPSASDRRSASAYWQDTFGPYENEKKEEPAESGSEKEKRESLHEQRQPKGEEESAAPPKKISGVGDVAFWTASRFGGALYVLKKDKDVLIRISLGGADNQETKIEKSKQLAQKAIDRL